MRSLLMWATLTACNSTDAIPETACAWQVTKPHLDGDAAAMCAVDRGQPSLLTLRFAQGDFVLGLDVVNTNIKRPQAGELLDASDVRLAINLQRKMGAYVFTCYAPTGTVKLARLDDAGWAVDFDLGCDATANAYSSVVASFHGAF